eukprot:259309-Chlamydomonas_euryale.AAC.1
MTGRPAIPADSRVLVVLGAGAPRPFQRASPFPTHLALSNAFDRCDNASFGFCALSSALVAGALVPPPAG